MINALKILIFIFIVLFFIEAADTKNGKMFLAYIGVNMALIVLLLAMLKFM